MIWMLSIDAHNVYIALQLLCFPGGGGGGGSLAALWQLSML